MASTTEDLALYNAQIGVVPAYDPANPYSVLDTPTAAYDQLILSSSQGAATVPPRGY